MIKRHLKRIAMPKAWSFKRKGIKFIARPNPGKHCLDDGYALVNFIRDTLSIATTAKEVKYLLNSGECLVDGVTIKDTHHIVGFMDVVSFPKIKKNYRLVIGKKGKLVTVECDDKESKIKVLKIVNKTKVKGNKIQVNLSDGRNMLVSNDTYTVGDSLVIELPSQKVVEHIKLEKGVKLLLSGGKHKGDLGELISIHDKNIIYKNEAGDNVETLKKYAYALGTGSSAVTVTMIDKK